MGNCIRRESSKMVWAAEDWGSLASKHRFGSRVMDEGDGEGEGEGDDHHDNASIKIEKQRLLGEKGGSSSLTSSPSTREVKIKITKKELEELVQRVDMQGLSLEEVLARLIEGNDRHQLQHQRSWRPVLQSIPEVN